MQNGKNFLKENNVKKLINLYGGPGIGKSVFAARLYTELSMRELCVELVGEYAKELIWQKDYDKLKYQPFVTKGQIKKLAPVGQCNIVITDSPLMLGLIYAKNEQHAKKSFKLIKDWHCNMEGVDEINILLKRDRSGYQENGRMESLEEASKKDEEIEKLLINHSIPYTSYSNLIHPAEVIRDLFS